MTHATANESIDEILDERIAALWLTRLNHVT